MVVIEIRLARENEITPQKELWKHSFGNEDQFIDFYYTHRYQPEKTAVLLVDGRIVSMLTMIPVRLFTPEGQENEVSMLYAVATLPSYRYKGLAGRLIDTTHHYLESKKNLSILVPAEPSLYDYYRRRGYQEIFYHREAVLSRDGQKSIAAGKSGRCMIHRAAPEEYNTVRNRLLRGTYYIAYHEEEIGYQKKLSQYSGADIYVLDIEESNGCAVVERISPDKVMIKEILLSEEYLMEAVQELMEMFKAREYIIRTPAWVNVVPGGEIHPFGMFRDDKKIGVKITTQDLGYLGLAFD